MKSFLELAGVAFCHGKGKRAITSPIIFLSYQIKPRNTISYYPPKDFKKNQMIISNSGLLAGYRNTNGSFNNRGTNANIWSSLESGSNAWRRNLNSGNATVNRNANNKLFGFSVRCIQGWFNLRTKYEF